MAPSPPAGDLAPSAAAMAPMARAVEDYLAGREQPIGFERDDGYLEELSPALFLEESGGPHEEAVLARCRGAVLDAGCGSGRTALRLQRAGLRVVGLDVSPELVEICRRRGVREVRVGSLWDDLGGPWDTIVLGGNNIGIAGSAAGAARLLEHLGAALAPGGAVLVTSVDVTRTDLPAHLAYHARNRAAGRAPGAVRMRLHYAGVAGAWFGWLHLAPAELAEAARAAGLHATVVLELPSGAYGAAVERG